MFQLSKYVSQLRNKSYPPPFSPLSNLRHTVNTWKPFVCCSFLNCCPPNNSSLIRNLCIGWFIQSWKSDGQAAVLTICSVLMVTFEPLVHLYFCIIHHTFGKKQISIWVKFLRAYRAWKLCHIFSLFGHCFRQFRGLESQEMKYFLKIY